MSAPWIINYIGIPFVANGRDRTGCDCYGLFRLALAEQFQIHIPLLSDDYTDPLNAAETRDLVHAWRPIILGEKTDTPAIGDCALIRFGALPHIGMYVGDGLILHTLAKTGSIAQRSTSVDLRGRVEGFYHVRENYSSVASILEREDGALS